MSFNIQEGELIVNNFNEFVENKFNEHIFSINSDEYNFDNVINISSKMEEFISEWENTNLEVTSGRTPKDYIASIEDFNDVLEFFKIFCSNSMDSIPYCIVNKLYSFGDKALASMVEILNNDVITKDITDFTILSDDDIYNVNLIQGTLKSIEILEDKAAGIWEDIVDLMLKCNIRNELFLEAGQRILTSMGKDVLVKVAEIINNTEEITTREEYMLLALSNLGYEAGNDEIYRCLRKSFKRMANKHIGAILIADYGDGRAVTMLRRYALLNYGKIDEEEYFSVLSAIDKLGGEIKDLLPVNRIN